MARPEGWRLERAAYPFGCTVPTRFQDMDPLGHINNVAMAAMFETGRVLFNQALDAFEHRDGARWLVAAVSISYLAEAHFPQDVEVRSGIGTIGTRSWRIDSAAFQQGVCVATCDTTLVIDATMPEALRQALGRQMVVQPD
jgi:acyl-CoA thioester hydrolase